MVGKCSATDLSPSNPEGLDFSRKSFRGGALKKSVGTAGKNQPDVPWLDYLSFEDQLPLDGS